MHHHNMSRLGDLYRYLHSKFSDKPLKFGWALHYGLQNARFDTNNSYVMWVEEDYCSPSLAMERESVLDRHFDDITVERVSSEEDGWKSIDNKPLLWSQ